MPESALTEEEIKKIFKTGEQYADRLLHKNSGRYEEMIDMAEDPAKASKILEETDKVIRENRERKLENALKRESYKLGLIPKDPYFLLCYKSISPLFYTLFYETGHRASEIENNDWSNRVMTGLIREESAGRYQEWLELFKRRRDLYYASFPEDIKEKLGVALGENNYQDIYKSHLVQYIRKIEKAEKRLD